MQETIKRCLERLEGIRSRIISAQNDYGPIAMYQYRLKFKCDGPYLS